MFPTTFRRAFVALLVIGLAGCGSTARAQSDGVLPVATVIAQIKRELAAAQSEVGANLRLKLEKVEATLLVARTEEVNGKAAIGVPAMGIELGGGGSRATDTSSTIYVALEPPRTLIAMNEAETRGFGLTQAIVETRKQLLEGIDQEPKLVPTKVVIRVKFGVTWSGGGTGQIKLAIISIGAGATSKVADSNEIALTFARADGP